MGAADARPAGAPRDKNRQGTKKPCSRIMCLRLFRILLPTRGQKRQVCGGIGSAGFCFRMAASCPLSTSAETAAADAAATASACTPSCCGASAATGAGRPWTCFRWVLLERCCWKALLLRKVFLRVGGDGRGRGGKMINKCAGELSGGCGSSGTDEHTDKARNAWTLEQRSAPPVSASTLRFGSRSAD